MNKTICPICQRELNRLLRPDFMLCLDCCIAVRLPSTIPATYDRLNVYSEEWIQEHSQNPTAQDVAESLTRIVGTTVPLGSSVLDIGCGSGVLVGKLNNMGYGYDASGLDWSEPATKFARKHYQGEYILANVEQGLSIGKTFGCAVASHILEHLENPHKFLQSVKKILEPEGYLVIAVPNLDWWNPKSAYRSVSTVFDPEHAVGYSPAGLRKVLKANGYDVMRMITRTHRLAILTAVLITAYHRMRSGKMTDEQGSELGTAQRTYSVIMDNPIVSRILSIAMKPFNRMSERRLRGMELIAMAKKDE